MKKKSKAIITFKDFEFYTVYQREGGYGQHDKKTLVSRANEDLRVEHIKGRPQRTEWQPISCSGSGMASVKYCATLTWNGLCELISNALLYEYYHNTMGILCDLGCLPAISLDSSYHTPSIYCKTSKEDLRRIFKSDYYDAIYELQAVTHVNCYVAVQVDNRRLEEAIFAVFGKYYDDLTNEQRKQIEPNINRYNELCELLNDYIEKLANDEDVEPDYSQFTIDFRQLALNFEETA